MSVSTGSNADNRAIWEYLLAKIGNEYGVAGLIGNLLSESGLRSNNMENTYESQLGYNDETYTKAVDDGTYTNFCEDHVGYGLAQWTAKSLKTRLFAYAKERGLSIGDYEMQCDFLVKDFEEHYAALWEVLKNAKSVKEASDMVLLKFERPANQSEANLLKRASRGEAIYAQFVKKEEPEIPAEPDDGKCYASKVIRVAEAEIGYKEKATNSNLDDKTANAGYGNWNKYARDFDTKFPNWYNGKKNGYDWCDIFVDWCFVTAYGYENALRLTCQPEKSFGAGCRSSLNYYKKKGQFHSGDPMPGDQIFFGKSITDVYHTGIVVAVEDGNVITVEGNNKDQVIKCTYNVGNRNIFGYGRPEYDIPQSELKPETPDAKQDETPANKEPKDYTVYVVKRGDTLSKIAYQYGTTYQELAKYNGISNPNIIKVGQEIRIPVEKPKEVPAEKKEEAATCAIGEAVKIKSGAVWWNGYAIPVWIMSRTMYVKQNHRFPCVAIGPNKSGEDVTGRIDAKYLTKA